MNNEVAALRAIVRDDTPVWHTFLEEAWDLTCDLPSPPNIEDYLREYHDWKLLHSAKRLRGAGHSLEVEFAIWERIERTCRCASLLRLRATESLKLAFERERSAAILLMSLPSKFRRRNNIRDAAIVAALQELHLSEKLESALLKIDRQKVRFIKWRANRRFRALAVSKLVGTDVELSHVEISGDGLAFVDLDGVIQFVELDMRFIRIMIAAGIARWRRKNVPITLTLNPIKLKRRIGRTCSRTNFSQIKKAVEFCNGQKLFLGQSTTLPVRLSFGLGGDDVILAPSKIQKLCRRFGIRLKTRRGRGE